MPQLTYPHQVEYSVQCFFCGSVHTSQFWDEIDETIMKCRERASQRDRGEIGDWVDNMPIIRCEAEIAK